MNNRSKRKDERMQSIKRMSKVSGKLQRWWKLVIGFLLKSINLLEISHVNISPIKLLRKISPSIKIDITQ